ncbi:MAG: discoidin domain-containing protein [Planctomycetota bacterium]|jgi:hypothetical protein
MADEVYFFSESYTYKPDVVLSTTSITVGSNVKENTIDYDKESYWETTDPFLYLEIDLGAVFTIDSLWFKSYNVAEYRLYYSDDGIVYTPAFSALSGNANGINLFVSFAARTKRYWRFNVTQETTPAENTLIYEIMLLEHRLTLQTSDQSLPAKINVRPNDRRGGSYQLTDGAATSFAGQTIFVDIALDFEYTPKANRDNLYNLFSNPYIRPPLTIYPDDEYPEGIYRVIWKSTLFDFIYSSSYKGSGFSGQIAVEEY